MNVGNIIEFAPGQKLDQLATIFTGDEDEIKKKLFGRGIVGGVGFPAAADVLTIGEVFELWKLDPKSWQAMAIGFNDYADATNDQKFYKLLRTINSQAGRLYGQTIPLILGGHPAFAIQAEFGAYPLSKKKRKEKISYLTGAGESISPTAMRDIEKLVLELEEAHGRTIKPR